MPWAAAATTEIHLVRDASWVGRQTAEDVSASPVAGTRAGELVIVPETLGVTERSGFTVIAGEVRNEGDDAVVFARVEIAALGPAGELVTAVSAVVWGVPCTPATGDPTRPALPGDECIPPGGTGLFQALLHYEGSAPPIESVLVSPSRTAVAAPGLQPVPQTLELVDDWEVLLSAPGASVTDLSGTVRNPGPGDVVGVHVTIAIHKPDGRLAGVARGFLGGWRLGGYLGGLHAGSELTATVTTDVDQEIIMMDRVEIVPGAWRYTGGRFRYGIAGLARGPGAEGSRWRSALTLANHSGAEAEVQFSLYVNGARHDNQLAIFEGQLVVFENIGWDLFGLPGAFAGHVQITSTTPLAVSGRTYNLSSMGSFGQSLPVFTEEMTEQWRASWGSWWSHSNCGLLPGLRGTGRFRTNLSLVNMSAGAVCFVEIRVTDRAGREVANLGTVALPPTSWRLLTDVIPDNVDWATAVLSKVANCSLWASASVIDGATNDPITVELVLDQNISFDTASGRGAWSPIFGWPD